MSQVSGPLLHSQLPALLSADIPWNAATTSDNAATATSLAATPSVCSAGQAATGVNASGAAQGCTTYLQTNQTITFTGDTTGSGSTSVALSTVRVNGLAIPASAAIAGTNYGGQFVASTVLPTSAEPAHAGDGTNTPGLWE
jgi:hypothetical protein